MCLVTGSPDNSQLPPAKDLKFGFKHAIDIDDDDLLNDLNGASPHPNAKEVLAISPDHDSEDEAFLKEELEEDEEEEDETLGGVADGVAGVKIESSGHEDDLTSPPSSPEARSNKKKKKKKQQEKRTRRINKQSSEKRKEKSRDAARCRRSKESKLYSALSDCLPLPHDVLANLDKASIMRLAIACLNTTDMVAKGLRVRHLCDEAESGCEDSALRDVCGGGGPYQEALLQAVDGFVLVLSTSGDVAFVSTTIANYLGLAQVDVMGASLYDLVHQCDHEDLRQLLATAASSQQPSQRPAAARRSSSTGGGSCRGGDGNRKAPSRRSRSTVAAPCPVKLPVVSTETSRQSEEEEEENEEEGGEYYEPRHGFIRMKCTLASRGRNVTIRNASFKVVEISGKMVLSCAPRSGGLTGLGWLICVASPVPHPANIEVPLDKTTYFSKHSLDMKFTYADENFPQFCGFLPRQLVGQSLFQLHHELDGPLLRKSFLTLRAKGQVSTGQYRFLAAGGGYVWLVTQATVIHAPRDSSPGAIVCLHYVISGVECPGQVLSCIQLLGGSPRPAALRSPRTGGGVGFCGSSTSSSVGEPADAGQQQPSSATHQDMLLIPPNTKDNPNTAKTLQQKTTGARGGGVLVGVSNGVPRIVPSSPVLLSPSCTPDPRHHQLACKAAGEQTTTRPETACGVAQTANHDLINKPSSKSYNTANNFNVEIDSAAPVPTICIDTSFMILDESQQQPDHDDTKPFSASASPFSSGGSSNSPSPGPVPLGGRSSSPSLGWIACGRSSAAPLLSQAAAELFCPQQRPSPPQEQFVSSTASLFETSLPSSDQLGLDGDALAWDRYLFPEGEAGAGSSTSDLFADINPSQLNLVANTNISQDMDIIDGATLFKNEPFCDGEEFDARAPFLPLCEDENLIMWSPSLELECETGGEDSAPDYGSNCSSISSCGSNSHSPVRQTNGDSGDSVYGTDGYLVSSANSTPGQRTILKREEDAPGSLLAELLQQSVPDCRPSDSQPPAACIDPNKVWPGHNRTPLPAPPPDDEEMFELDRFLQEDNLQEYGSSGRSPTLASASLTTVNLAFTPSPASSYLSYSSSLSPALSALTPFSCNTSSPVCSPLTPDPHPTTKRRSSPMHSPQMSRKRLCSPHVEESQLQQQLKCSSQQREPAKSSRKLQTPNAPYMQQLLVSKHIPGKCSNSSKCVRSCGSCCKAYSGNDGNEVSSSVLRNLLVSGHDASGGHYVLPPSPCHSPDTSDSSSPAAEATISIQRSPAPDRSARRGSSGSTVEKHTSRSPASAALRSSGGSRAEARGCTSPTLRSSRNSRSQPRPLNTSPPNTRDSHSHETKGYRKIIPCTVVRDIVSSSPSSNAFGKPVFSIANSRSSPIVNVSESGSFVTCKLLSSVPVSSSSVDGNNFSKAYPQQNRLAGQTEQATILISGESDSACSGSLPLLLRRTPSGELKLVRLTTCKSAVFTSQSRSSVSTAPQRPKSENAAPPNNLRYPNILPKSPRESERNLNAEACKGRLLMNSSGGSNRRLMALPKGMTLVPRLQMIQSRPTAPPTLYRVVAAEQATPRPPDPQLLPISNRGRTLLIRGAAQEKDGGSSFVTAKNLKPVRLINERNVVEYVCQEEDPVCDQQQVIRSPDCFYASDDSFEWVEVVEDGSNCIDNGSTCSPLLKEGTGNPRSFYSPMLGNVRNDRCTETAKCLLLPQHEYSPVTMFRLTQSDYDVNAPAPTDLLRGQELLEALDKTLQ